MAVDNEYEYNQVRNNGAVWQELVARIKKMPGANICWRCGLRIDMKLLYTNPMSWSVDHVQSLANGGKALDINNCKPAHRSCNSKRAAFKTNHPHSRDW